MEILLAVVAAIIVIAILAILYLKKKQQPLDSTPSVPNIVKSTSPAPVLDAEEPSSAASLAHIDTLISSQRYDEAKSQLKTLLMTNTKDAGAMLKLLKVYALTNNASAFEQLHARILQTGNADVIADANVLHSLFAEEQAAVSAPAVGTPVSAPDQAVSAPDEGLDFDGLDFNSPSTPSVQDTPSLDSLDLDGFNTPTLTTEPETNLNDFDLDFGTSSPAPTTHDELSENFDLSFDEPATPTLEAPTLETAETEFSLEGFDDTLSLDAASMDSVELADEPSLDFDTGLGDLSLDSPSLELNETSLDLSSTSISTEAPTLDDGLEFGDFSLDEPKLSTPTLDINETSLDSDLLDNDFGGLETDSLLAEEPSLTSSDDLGGLDEFTLDEPSLDLSTPSLEPSISTSVADEPEFGDFDLGSFGEPSPASTNDNATLNEVSTPSLTDNTLDESFELEDFSLDTPSLNAPSLDTAGLDTSSLDTELATEFDTNFDANLETHLDAPSLDAPANVSVDVPLVDDLEFGDFELNSDTKSTLDSSLDLTDGAADSDAFLYDTASQLDALSGQNAETTLDLGNDFASELDGSLETSLDDTLTLDSTLTDTVGTGLDDALLGDTDSTHKPETVTEPTDFSSEFDFLTDGSLDTPKAEDISEPSTKPTSSVDLTDMLAPAAVTAGAAAALSSGSSAGGLDNAQVTLELANQYLNLGELDSAKRLLSEVIEFGSGEQQQTAKALLARLV